MQEIKRTTQNSTTASINLNDDEYFFMSNGLRKRKIYLNVEYSKEEWRWIKMVRSTLKKQGLFEVQDDSIILKIYYSSDLDLDKTIKKLKLWHKWFTTPQIQCLTEQSKSILREGFVYSNERTKSGRPLVNINVSLVNFDRYQAWSYYQAMNHVLSRVVKQQFIPGKIEFYHVLIDLDEHLLTLPFTSLIKFLEESTEAYNSCMEKIMIVNCTPIAKWIVNRVLSFMPDESTRKVSIYTKEELMEGQLMQFIDSSVLQEKYGGSKPNIDHSQLFRQEQISDEYSQSTEYYSMQNDPEYRDSCCGGKPQCTIF